MRDGLNHGCKKRSIAIDGQVQYRFHFRVLLLKRTGSTDRFSSASVPLLALPIILLVPILAVYGHAGRTLVYAERQKPLTNCVIQDPGRT